MISRLVQLISSLIMLISRLHGRLLRCTHFLLCNISQLWDAISRLVFISRLPMVISRLACAQTVHTYLFLILKLVTSPPKSEFFSNEYEAPKTLTTYT